MAVDKQALFDEMRLHNMPYWKIMNGKSKSAMFKCDTDINDIDSQISTLNKRLKGIKHQSCVDVIISDKTNKQQSEEGGNSFNRLTVELENDDELIGNAQSSFDPSIFTSMNDASMKNLEKLQEERHKLEIAKLEFAKDKEIAALKEEFAKLREELTQQDDDDDDDGMGALKPLMPFIPAIMSKLGIVMPSTNNMAGTNENITESPKITTEDQIDPELQKQEIKAAAAISKLLKIDNKAGDALLMLSEFATLSPESYFSFIPVLKGQLEFLKSK